MKRRVKDKVLSLTYFYFIGKNLRKRKEDKMNYWIWFSTIEGIGAIKKKKLLDSYKTPEKIFQLSKEKLLEVCGISEKNVDSILKSKDIELMNKYEAYIQKNNIQMINMIDKDYPEKLKNIADPPITLFCIGDISLLNKVCIGIVGSRNPSYYGIQMATKFSKELSRNRNNHCKWSC